MNLSRTSKSGNFREIGRVISLLFFLGFRSSNGSPGGAANAWRMQAFLNATDDYAAATMFSRRITPGAANVIAADLTPLPTVVSVLLIRMPIERRKCRLAPKDETSAECHTGAPWAVQAPADRVPEPQGEGAPAPCIDFLLRYSPLDSTDGRHLVSAHCCIA